MRHDMHCTLLVTSLEKKCGDLTKGGETLSLDSRVYALSTGQRSIQ